MDNHEQLQKEIERIHEKRARKRSKMKVSGKSVLKLQEIIKEKGAEKAKS